MPKLRKMGGNPVPSACKHKRLISDSGSELQITLGKHKKSKAPDFSENSEENFEFAVDDTQIDEFLVVSDSDSPAKHMQTGIRT